MNNDLSFIVYNTPAGSGRRLLAARTLKRVLGLTPEVTVLAMNKIRLVVPNTTHFTGWHQLHAANALEWAGFSFVGR